MAEEGQRKSSQSESFLGKVGQVREVRFDLMGERAIENMAEEMRRRRDAKCNEKKKMIKRG